MKRIEAIALVLILSCSAFAADTHFTGSSSKDWLTPGNWDSGLPTSTVNAYVNRTVDANVNATGAAGFICYVDNGRTLTINPSGYLTLSSTSAAALRLGNVGDANLVINGGTLKHAYRYGGDFKCGNGTGISMSPLKVAHGILVSSVWVKQWMPANLIGVLLPVLLIQLQMFCNQPERLIWKLVTQVQAEYMCRTALVLRPHIL
jgi:hypothetical protein